MGTGDCRADQGGAGGRRPGSGIALAAAPAGFHRTRPRRRSLGSGATRCSAGPGRWILARRCRFAKRPSPTPPFEARPKRFSVTEIETLRRDPYAVYARRILGLEPIESLAPGSGRGGDGARFSTRSCIASPKLPSTRTRPMQRNTLGQYRPAVFCGMARLPADVEAVWWPRFERWPRTLFDGSASIVRGDQPTRGRTRRCDRRSATAA